MNFAALALLANIAVQTETPGVRCVLVVPDGEQPSVGIQDKLDTVLKDVQWFYSCQMEAHGYGAKTFSLELDDKGKVVIHTVKLPSTMPPTTDDVAHRSAVVAEAEKVVGKAAQRKGTVMVLAYDGYYWTNREAFQMKPMGWGLNGKWAHLTGWHMGAINPKNFTNITPIPSLPENNPFLSPIATKVYQTYTGDGTRTVGERASCSTGTFIHEIGHSFGLHHPAATDPKWVGDLMLPDGFWNARGNFVANRGDWCCVTPDQAAILNKNPLFQVRKVGLPSTGVARSIGMRGAVDSKINPRSFAQIEAQGSGFTVEAFGKGQKSQSNRDYVWKDVPSQLQGMRFTRVGGGKAAQITVQAASPGRLYVACAEIGAGVFKDGGWQMISPTISYASPDMKRVFPMALYYRNVRPGDVIEIPQREWAGTIVIAPGRR